MTPAGRGFSAPRMQGRHGWANRLRALLALSDAFVVLLVMVIAQYTRIGLDADAAVAGPNSPPYIALTGAIGALWWILLGAFRSREARILGHGPQEFQRVATASVYAFVSVAVVGYVTQWQISRSYLLVALPLGLVALAVYRGVWRLWIHAERDAGRLQTDVYVVGPELLASDLAERLRRGARSGYHVAGIGTVGMEGPQAEDDQHGSDLPGHVAAASALGAEFIVVAGSDSKSLEYSRRLGWELEGTGVGLIVAPALAEVAGPRVLVTPVEGLPLIHVDTPTFDGAKYWVKSAADRIGAAFLLLCLALPMGLVAILVKATSPGPVLFRQQRIGLGTEPFTMLKFRSMSVDSEDRLADAMHGDVGVYYKRKDDPRVTAVGRFIRRFSIDELPQLVNVLRGDMSLVGPRPQVQEEVDQYTEVHARRLLVKPGLTGLWQVSGRSDLSVEESIRLDAYYVENWSLTGDILILLRTFAAVLNRRGAY